MTEIQLTPKQLRSFESVYGRNERKHWSQKAEHCINQYNVRLTGFSDFRVNHNNLEWFIETYLPGERKRIDAIRLAKERSGEINTNRTPCDVDGTFEAVESPVIGEKYHLSWASKGAVFVLKRITGNICYLDNPKYRRKKLLTAKVHELRKLRSKSK